MKDWYQWGLLFVAALTTLHSAEVAAQVNGLDLDDPANERLVRFKYEGTPALPYGVAFVATIRSSEALYAIDRETALFEIEEHMGYSQADAEKFLVKLREVLERYDAMADQRSRRVLCKGGATRETGDDLLFALELADDARDQLAGQMYMKFSAALDDGSRESLQDWLDEAKLHITHGRMNYSETAKVSGGTAIIEQSVSALCAATK